MSDEIRDTILAEIATHIRVHGTRNWELVRERYPDIIGSAAGKVGERKFFRWVEKVKKGDTGTIAAAAREVKSKVGRHLPVAPPPQYLVRGGAEARKNIDFLKVLSEVAADIELVRETASTIDEATGKRKIKNPVMFNASIKNRMDMLQTGLNLMREVWDLQMMEDFYAEVISIIADEIAPLEPEVAQRIMLRLKALNDRRGMTPHAGEDF